jgi:hypothetical protein
MKERITINMDKCLHCVLWDAIRVYRKEVPHEDKDNAIFALIRVLGDFIAGDHDHSQDYTRDKVVEVLDKQIALNNSQKEARRDRKRMQYAH